MMKALLKKCSLRLVIFIIYGFIGSWIFTLIEKRNEAYTTTASRTLRNLRKAMKNKYNLTDMSDFDFNQFVQAAYDVIRMKKQRDWTVANGLGFTFPALTTVGYGDITPKTPLGQGLTIPYCLIGLPLTMLALKTSGEVILRALRAAIQYFEKKLLGRQNPKVGYVELFCVIIFCQVLLILIFTFVEMQLDGWSFQEGVYCWFITFTTIGFGDYVPFTNLLKKLQHKAWLAHIIALVGTFPFIVGLVLVSSLLNLLMEISEKIKMRQGFVKSCSVCKANRLSDTNDDDDADDFQTREVGGKSVLVEDHYMAVITSL